MVHNSEYYKPEVKDVENLCGFSGEVGREGKVSVIESAFLTSFNQFHSKIMGNAVRGIFIAELKSISHPLNASGLRKSISPVVIT